MLSCSFSFVLILPILLFFSLPLTRPAHTNLQIRSSDQVTLAVAANNPITRKKDDPFDTMKLRRSGVEADVCATPCVQTKIVAVASGKVQTRRRERRECKKKKKKRKRKRRRRRRENEKLNYDSRTSNICREMKVSLRDWCHWKPAY